MVQIHLNLTDITSQESSEDNYSLSFDGVDDYVDLKISNFNQLINQIDFF